MRRDPGERYPDALELARDLRAWLEGRVVSAHDKGLVARLAKWVRRNRAAAGVGAAVLSAALVALVAFSTWRARAAAEVLSLSDTVLARELRAEAEELFWPPSSSTRERIDEWISRCESLLLRAPGHRESLAALASTPALDQQRRFRADLLERLVADLDELASPDARDSLHAARAALARLDELAERGPARAEAWRLALERIRANPLYRPAIVAARDELHPLGPDPATLLEEFALSSSGSLPTRDGEGRLDCAEDAALVLVLVPGGRSHVGSIYGSRPGADPDATLDEAPRGLVDLAPHWIAKHELTQAQARRLWGLSSSHHVGSGRLPVESLSWLRLAELLPRAGLDFPDEARWEQAARATTQTRWWTGDEPSTLAGAANLRGLRVEESMPVGSLRANAYGLHDTIGNVAEWVRGARDDDGELGLRSLRGGHYDSPPERARCAAVERVDAGHVDRRAGVRPMLRAD
jgi:hypothetical protein